MKILFKNNNTVQSYGQFYKWRWSKFSRNIQNICGHKSETMWYMELKISMGDKIHKYYKHTKFVKIREVTLDSWLIWHGMTHIINSWIKDTFFKDKNFPLVSSL